jgi:hypothetical protein
MRFTWARVLYLPTAMYQLLPIIAGLILTSGLAIGRTDMWVSSICCQTWPFYRV